MPSPTPPCPLLHRLPPELRLQIYTHLFSTPTHTSLLLRSTTKLETISAAKNAHSALLKTCRTIYTEAAPLLYSNTTFRIQIYPVGGFPAAGNPGLDDAVLRTTAYLPRIRRLEIKACILFANQMSAVLRLLEVLTAALEVAEAEIVSLKVHSNLGLSLQWKKLVNQQGQLDEGSDQSGERKTRLFRRVLAEMEEGALDQRALKGE